MSDVEATHRWQASKLRDARTSTFQQGDGAAPRTVLSARWPGEKGVSVSWHRFTAGAHVNAVPADHLIIVQPKPVALMRCRVADERLDHQAPPWNMTVCPASAPCEGECDDDVDMIIISIPTDTFAFASLDRNCGSILPLPRLNACDETMIRLVKAIVEHAALGADRAPLWWDQMTDCLVEQMLGAHAGASVEGRAPRLQPGQLTAIKNFVNDAIDGPISVDGMAASIGLSRFHFTRAFANTTNLTPHRFVMRTRLRHAHELLRRGRYSAVDAALASGFVDQSHLANWTRRMLGTTISKMRGEEAADRLGWAI